MCSMGSIANSSRLWVGLLFLLQFICNGVAIKCYVCDSSDNPSCANLDSNSSIVAEECTLDKTKSINTWLFELNRFAYFDMGSTEKPLMNCQKVVAQNPNNQVWVTARFCQLDTGSTDACNILRTRLKIGRNDEQNSNGRSNKARGGDGSDGKDAEKAKDGETFFCDICNTDSCNGSTSLEGNIIASVILLLLSIIVQRQLAVK